MLEGDGHAALVEACREQVVIIGAIDVVLGVLLARPHDLDRAIHLLGDLHGLGDAVYIQTPAEAAAEVLVVNLNLFLRQTGNLCRRHLGTNRDLSTDPDIAPIFTHVNGAVHRLHGGMGQKGHLVDRFDLLHCAGDRLVDVAVPFGHQARLARSIGQLPHDVGAGETRIRPVVPSDDERSQSLLGRAHMVRHHGHGAVETHHLADAVDRLRLAVIHIGELAAEHRAGCNGRDLHAGGPDIDAELGPAVHLVGSVQALRRRPDQRPVLGVLELDLVRHPQRRCGIGHLAIGDLATRRHMDHLAALGAAGGCIHAPALCCGGNEHGARGSADAAQRVKCATNGSRAPGCLLAQNRI